MSLDAWSCGCSAIQTPSALVCSSVNRNPDYLFTLFVPDRARTAFPLFDQPDLKARYQLTLSVPRGWLAMSNANVLATTIKGPRR